MSERIVAKRFALKFSPRPTIALEYQRAAPDPGLSTIKVRIAKLSPTTHDVQGVVDALQKKYPGHLGSDLVNILQLKRLVAILLLRGREYLPQAYLSVPAPSLDDIPNPSAQAAAHPGKPPSLSDVLSDDAGKPGCLSSGPTPAPTPEVQRVSSVRSDEGAALSDSGSHVPEGDVRVDGAASAKGKRDVEDRPMATLSVALEGARFSAPPPPPPPPPEELLPQRNSDGAERRQRERDDDLSREAKEGKIEPLPTVGIAHSAGPQQDTTTMDDTSEESVNGEEKKTAVAKDEYDDHIDDDDYGDNEGNDGGVTIGLAPSMSPSALDTGASVHEASGKGRPESRRQENNGNEEEKGRDKKLEDEEDKEGEIEGLDEVSEILEMVDSEDSKEEMEVTGVQGASGEQEQGLDAVRGNGTRTEPYVSNAAAAERATIAPTLSGIGNDSVFDTLRESTEAPEEEVGQAESDDSTGKSPLSSERSTVPSGRRGLGHTDDKNIAEIEVPMPGDRGAAAKPSASSPPLPLPTPVAAVLAPPRSLSPSSLLPETGASSASSLAGLPLPPVGGGRPRFGLLGSLPPVGGRGLPSLALRSGAGIGETKREADSSDATSAISGADRSDHNNSAPPPPPPPPPGVFGSSARTEGAAGGGGVGLDRSDPQGDDTEDVEGSTSKAAALPGSPRQHQGQEEEAAGVGSAEDTQGPDRATVAAEKAQGEDQDGGREESGGYFGDSGGEISEQEIPEEVSSGDSDISFEQDSSDGGAGAGGGDDDYFS